VQPDSVYGPMSQATSQRFRTTPSQHYSNTVPEDERSVLTATNKVVHYTPFHVISTRADYTSNRIQPDATAVLKPAINYIEASSGKYPSEVRGITILMPYRDNTQHHGRKR